MSSASDLYLISMGTMYICFSWAFVTLQPGFDHMSGVPVQMYGFSQNGRQAAWLVQKDFGYSNRNIGWCLYFLV